METPKTPVRILVLADHYLPDVSGTAIRTANLIEPLVQWANCHIHVATLDFCTRDGNTVRDQLSVNEQINGVHVHRYKSMYHLVSQLPQLHRREQFNVVHTRGSRLASYALLIFSVHRIPVVLELNYLFQQRSLVRGFLWRQTLQRVRRTIVLSESARDWLRKEMCVDSTTIDVIVNGIDSRKFIPSSGQEIRDKLGLSSEAVVVGYLGTFWDWQGVLEIVRSAAQVVPKMPHVHYLMVGEGPAWSDSQQLVEKFGLSDSFIFTGSVDPSLAPRYLAAMDIFMLARPRMLLNELAIPLKLLEAMAMELAVIVTDLPALTEVVTDNVNGVVANPDTTSIAMATERLVRNESLRHRLGEMARKMVIEKYSWGFAASQLLQTYTTVLNAKE